MLEIKGTGRIEYLLRAKVDLLDNYDSVMVNAGDFLEVNDNPAVFTKEELVKYAKTGLVVWKYGHGYCAYWRYDQFQVVMRQTEVFVREKEIEIN